MVDYKGYNKKKKKKTIPVVLVYEYLTHTTLGFCLEEAWPK